MIRTSEIGTLAPAKVNLTLHVIGRRADGYHDIESLVVFAGVGDALTFTPGRTLALAVRRADRAGCGRHFRQLWCSRRRTRSPRASTASGSGASCCRSGCRSRPGSAAARPTPPRRCGCSRAPTASRSTIQRLMQAARATGADVPVCVDPRPRLMRGIGEILSAPLALPRLPAVLVNPGVAVPTKDVFAALRLDTARNADASLSSPTLAGQTRVTLLHTLSEGRNDLEAPAISLAPVIAEVLSSLRALAGCGLARMSGSGATCFGLFDTGRAAAAGARTLRARHPTWWIRATTLA